MVQDRAIVTITHQ